MTDIIFDKEERKIAKRERRQRKKKERRQRRQRALEEWERDQQAETPRERAKRYYDVVQRRLLEDYGIDLEYPSDGPAYLTRESTNWILACVLLEMSSTRECLEDIKSILTETKNP